jgi:asparagine synthase (glutamine-hydrolysing)
MPGLMGVVSRSGPIGSGGPIERMASCMRRVRSDSTGVVTQERLGVSCGWVCAKGSFSDCMPLWNEVRNICLIFWGEEYADQAEMHQLQALGHRFAAGNGSYLVHQYEQHGLAFLTRLNGGFSGLVIDLREDKAVLFNDRYGLGRIYFHENENGFYFSSEAKALLKVLPELRRLDLRGLGEFFSCGCVLQNRTLFSGLGLLPPGSAWTFGRDARVRKQTYFNTADWAEQAPLLAADYYERLKETWRRILPRYLRGKDKVAMSLTGGVDSRMILAWAGRPAGTLPCYTFGGRYRECADVKIAREVAQICGQPHQVIPVGEEFLSRYPALAEQTVYLSDGTMDVAGTIDLYVQEKARDIAPVRVMGTNGGEILRSLVAFKPMPLRQDLLAPEVQEFCRTAARTYREELRGHRLTFTAFKQAPWYMGSKFVVERSGVALRMPYFDNDLVRLVYQAPPELRNRNALSLRLIADGNPALEKLGTDRGVALDGVGGLWSPRKLLQEFLFKAEYAYDYGMPQWLARLDHSLAPLRLERLFLGRHKFHHFRVFYRDELSDYVRAVLLDSHSLAQPYLCSTAVKDTVKGHLSGSRNFTLEIHKLLTIELVLRLLTSDGGTVSRVTESVGASDKRAAQGVLR